MFFDMQGDILSAKTAFSDQQFLLWSVAITNAKKIIEAAQIYGSAERAAILFSMGITQHITGVNNVLSTANLAMLTGNIGRRGSGVNPLRGQNNVQGACDVGALPDLLPGYQKVVDPEARRRLGDSWEVTVPSEPGLTLIEKVNGAGEKIKVMFVMGENPLMSDPDTNHVRKQFDRFDFLIVSELFLSETAEIADVVLPAVSFAEKDGTFTNTDAASSVCAKPLSLSGMAALTGRSSATSLPAWATR
jgi:predicted molibdopterin-dependent oxidoreductase YjgC